MVKLVYCIRRKPGLSREAFIRPRRVWRSSASGLDGMVELWFDDVAALLAARQSPAWAASTADEAEFVDPAGSAYFVCEERQIL